MTRMAIDIEDKTFWLKIGPLSIMYLSQIPNYSEEDVFYASIITLHSLSRQDANTLYQQATAFNPINYQPLFEEIISFLSLNMRDLYRKAVGEVGIDPAIFFQMSIEEIEMAYDGYLRRQELAANLNKLAFLQALSNDKEQIQVAPALEYNLGTAIERDNTFTRLERQSNDRL